MKHFFIKVAAVAVVAMGLFVACEKSEDQNQLTTTSKFINYETTTKSITAKSLSFATSVKIECPGCPGDGCSQKLVRNGGNWYTECGNECGQCSMVITQSKLSYASNAVVTETFAANTYEVHFYDGFLQHVAAKHGTEAISIKTIEIISDPLHDTYSIMYNYVNSRRELFSVRFSLTSGASTKIDCSGTCDCRERYYHTTGATECTCSPCHMDVTNVSSNLY